MLGVSQPAVSRLLSRTGRLIPTAMAQTLHEEVGALAAPHRHRIAADADPAAGCHRPPARGGAAGDAFHPFPPGGGAWPAWLPPRQADLGIAGGVPRITARAAVQ